MIVRFRACEHESRLPMPEFQIALTNDRIVVADLGQFPVLTRSQERHLRTPTYAYTHSIV